MFQKASRLYWKTLPRGSLKNKCLSYQLMYCNGLLQHSGNGLFTILPLGSRIVDKLQRIVEYELTAAGAQKFDIPILGSEEVWQRSGRWRDMQSEMFHLTDRHGKNFCLQPTAEEMATMAVQSIGVLKLRSLPLMLFQTTQKFRDEMNPRFGLLRSRQFLMNDLYTFDRDEASAADTYDLTTEVYRRIFVDILKLPNVYRVEADPGHMGGSVSHEFHLPNACGQETLKLCDQCYMPASEETNKMDESDCQNCHKQKSASVIETIEIAHTFQLGTRYTQAFGAFNEKADPYQMSCFGIGITRAIAASIDLLSVSDKAMRLPHAICPYTVAIILSNKSELLLNSANDLVNSIGEIPRLRGDVLLDDRIDRSIGRRLNELNSLGIPHILIASAAKTSTPSDCASFEYFRYSL
jgi:prolyl-tRNA synthetase